MRHPLALSITWEQRLARGPLGEVWHVRRRDGTPMVAKQIGATTLTQRARLWKLVRRQRALGPPLVPFVDAVVGSSGIWLLRELDPGVPLTQLVAVSPLSRRQAAAIAAGCLVALSRLHGAGVLHGRMHSGNVFVEPDGSIHVVDAGLNATLAGRNRRVAPASDVLAAANLICTVWPGFRADRAPGVRDLFEAARLGDAGAACAALEVLAAAVPASALRRSPDLALAAVAARLLAPDAVRAPVRPLPNVITEPIRAATAGTPAGRSRAGRTLRLPELVRVKEAVRERASVFMAGHGRLQRAGAGHTVAASVAVAATFIAAQAVAHSTPGVARIAAPAEHAGPQHSTHPASPPKPTHAPAPASTGLQPAAASSAGFVRQVELVPLGACGAGDACALKSVLNLEAPHGSTGITWEVVAVDRCTGAQSVLRSASRPVDPSWNVVWTTDQFTLPSPDPALLYAVTVTPWRVASAPVATAGTCAGRT